MTQLENKILKDLYESVNGLFAFTFYSRYRIEPGEMVAFISKYAEKGFVVYNDDKLLLTDDGKEAVLRKSNFSSKPGRFANIPKEFLAEKMIINSPYLPNISDIPSEILNIKEGGIETSIKEV